MPLDQLPKADPTIQPAPAKSHVSWCLPFRSIGLTLRSRAPLPQEGFPNNLITRIRENLKPKSKPLPRMKESSDKATVKDPGLV